MGFSLRNLLNEAVAQVNPFDHGATAHTAAQSHPVFTPPQQQPQPTSSAPALNVVNQPQNMPQLTAAPPPTFHINTPVQIAHPAPLNIGNTVIPQTPGGVAGAQGPNMQPHNIVAAIPQATSVALHDVINAGASTAKGIGQIASTPYNAGKLAFDQSVNRFEGKDPNASPAAQNALNATNRDINSAEQFAQFTPRAAVQLADSAVKAFGQDAAKRDIAQALGQKDANRYQVPSSPQLDNFTPNGAVQKTVLGSQPIPSLQQTYKTTQAQQGTQKAAIDTALTGAMDVLAAKGGVDSVLEKAPAAVDAVKQTAPKIISMAQDAAAKTSDAVNGALPSTAPLNEAGAVQVPKIIANAADAVRQTAGDIVTNKPYRNITDAELTGAQKVRDANMGYGSTMDLTDQNMKDYYSVMKKAGGNGFSDVKAVDTALGARRTYDTQQAYKNSPEVKQGGYARIPGKGQPAEEPVAPGSARNSVDSSAKSSTSGMKERSLTKNMKVSPEFSPDLQSQIESEYKPFTNKAATMSTDKFMKQPLNKAQEQVMQSLASGGGRHAPGATGNAFVEFGKQEVSNASAVMKALDAKGDVAGAQAVHDLLAQKLTNAGQTAQAATLIYNRTPQGMLNMAYRDLTKSGVKITPELKGQLDSAKKNIEAANPGSRNETVAKAKFAKLVENNLPSTTGSKIVSLYKTGILSAPMTAVKVGIVNPITNVLEQAKDIPAAAVDAGVGAITGKRTVVAPNAQNIAAGLKTLPTAAKDVKLRFMDNIALPGSTGMGVQELSSSGIDHPMGARFGINKRGEQTMLDKATGGVSSKILNGYTSSIGRVHGSLQIPGYEARAAQSIMQQAQAEAITQGLKGAEKDAFIKQFVANPPKAAYERAQLDAQYATSQQHTALGSAASGLQRTMPGGQFIAPITRIPGAVATQMINYSPAGFLKTAAQAAIDKGVGKEFDQRGFSQGMGRAIVGSSLMAGGAALAAQGRMSGAYPQDKGTQALWQSANIPENSVYVGGHAFPDQPWRNYGGKWEQIGSPGGAAAQSALAGGAAYEGYKKGGIGGAALQGAQGGAQIATNQPYLAGIAGAMGAINTPDQAKSFLDQSAGSIVPNFIRGLATATDPNQRQTAVQSPLTSMKNSITNGIPGLRENNLPQVDVYGNVLKRNASPLSTYLNPFKPQGSTPSPLVDQLGQIHAAQDVNGKALTIPTQINKKYQINVGGGQKVALTDAQRTQFIQATGKASQAELNQLIKSSQYQNASEEQRSKMISDVVSGQRNIAVNQISAGATKLTSQGKAAQANRLPTINAKNNVTTSTGSVKINSNIDPNLQSTIKKYAAMSTADRNKAFATDNAAQYNYDNALYQNKVANNELSTAQKISGAQTIAKEKIGSNYSQNVRQLYSLSKTQLAAYLSGLPNDQAAQLYSQLSSYGQDLKNAGLESSNKVASLTSGGGKVPKVTSKHTISGSYTPFTYGSGVSQKTTNDTLKSLLGKVRIASVSGGGKAKQIVKI